MTPSVIHSGRVYQWKSQNKWKEQWLCLEETGHLVWKRKDAYQIKGSVDLERNIDKVFLPTPTEKQLGDKQHPGAYFFSVPMTLHRGGDDPGGKLIRKLFAVLNVRDLELWLDAMATSVDKWKLFKAVSDRHKQRVSKSKHCDADCIEELLTHHEAVPFLRTIWDEFLAERRNPMALQEISESMCLKTLSASQIFTQVPPSPTKKVPEAEYPRGRISSLHSDSSEYITTSGSEDEISMDFHVNPRKSVDLGILSRNGLKMDQSNRGVKW